MDRFIEGIKYSMRVEILKSRVENSDECAHIALNVGCTKWRAETSSSKPFNNGSTPVEVGNIQNGLPERLVCGRREHCKKDLENGACFVCCIVGCRPLYSKHRDKRRREWWWYWIWSEIGRRVDSLKKKPFFLEMDLIVKFFCPIYSNESV